MTAITPFSTKSDWCYNHPLLYILYHFFEIRFLVLEKLNQSEYQKSNYGLCFEKEHQCEARYRQNIILVWISKFGIFSKENQLEKIDQSQGYKANFNLCTRIRYQINTCFTLIPNQVILFISGLEFGLKQSGKISTKTGNNSLIDYY